MSLIDPPSIARPVIRSIVVPASIYHASAQANLNLMDLLVFDKLRKIASLEDVAIFAALNDNIGVGGTRIATSALKDIMTLGSGNAIEMNAIFNTMSKTDEVQKLAINSIDEYAAPISFMMQLTKTLGTAKPVENTSMRNTLGSALTSSDDLPYQLKTSGSNVFIVVGSGFNKYVGAPLTKEESKTFVRDFLKLCVGLYSPAEVARHPLFKSFLYTLAD